MIIGLLSDVAQQRSILPKAVFDALTYVMQQKPESLATGRYASDNDKMFFMVQEPNLRTLETSRSEAHNNYADIQIPLTAGERYGISLPEPGLVATEDLLAQKDVAYYQNPANEFFVDILPGTYAVFFPHELHRPCVAIDECIAMRKLVIKIHKDLLQ
jgi:biofilm protein TabA